MTSLAALPVGRHGEWLTQCPEVFTMSKAMPVQVDAEPCKFATWYSHGPEQPGAEGQASRRHPVPEQLWVHVSTVSMHE